MMAFMLRHHLIRGQRAWRHGRKYFKFTDQLFDGHSSPTRVVQRHTDQTMMILTAVNLTLFNVEVCFTIKITGVKRRQGAQNYPHSNFLSNFLDLF